MNKFLVLVFILSLSIITGCKEDKKDKPLSEKVQMPQADFNYEIKSITKESLSNCKENPCPKIDIHYLQLTNEAKVAQKINQSNQKDLSSLIFAEM